MINIRKSIFKKMPLYLGLAIITFSSLQQTIAYAIDVDFYSRNDILYYDPTSCTVTNQSGDIAVVGNDNAEKIFKFLISTKFSGLGDKPFNAIQAAGALGNFFQESSMDPGALEPIHPPYVGEGHGLAQWSYATTGGVVTGPGRLGVLLDLAKTQGKAWSDLSLQLQMIQNEINSSYGASLLADGFGEVTTPTAASFIFQFIYEGAGEPNQATRDSAAQSYYTQYQSLAPGDVTINGASTTTCANGSVSGGLTNFSGNDFKIFNQCNYPPYGGPWGDKVYAQGVTGCVSGCGPTSLAMVVANMTGQSVTPQDTLDYYDKAKLWYGFGIGSDATGLKAGAEHWGLKTEAFNSKDINSYKSVLDGGGLIILGGQGAAPFMSSLHYIVIRGITSSGQFLIGDPGQAESTNGPVGSPRAWDTGPIIMNSLDYLSVAITK
jgi:hypothetical protein